MVITFDKMNFNLILKDLGSTCLKCPECIKSDCLVGYAKNCITNCVKENILYVSEGMTNIPLSDIKSYSQEQLIIAIGNILHLCASCKENHFESCIVNIIRSCYEVELFGESQEYDGNVINYIIKLNRTEYKKAIASKIVDQFHKTDYLHNK